MFHSPIETIYFIILTGSKNEVWKDYASLIGGHSWWVAERVTSHPILHFPTIRLLPVKWSVSHIIRAALPHSAHNDRGYCCLRVHLGFCHHSPLVAKLTTHLRTFLLTSIDFGVFFSWKSAFHNADFLPNSPQLLHMSYMIYFYYQDSAP